MITRSVNAIDVSTQDDLRDADLRGANLQGADLAGRDLSGADLSGADLSRARLAGANLRSATLRSAVLDGTQLLGTDLTEADLTASSARGAVFGQCDLTDAACFGVDFTDASLSGATLRRSDLRGSTLDGARLLGSDLTDADLSRASLKNTDLAAALVKGALFVSADLAGSSLRGIRGFEEANWLDVVVLDIDFAGAYLVRRVIMDQNYLHEFRSRGGYHELTYRLWKMTSDCGRSFARWGALTALLAVLFALAFTQVDVDYGDHETALSPLYFSIVTLTTLGYGDVLPASIAAQILVLIEVVVGYVMLGGVLSIFATRMGRRAD